MGFLYIHNNNIKIGKAIIQYTLCFAITNFMLLRDQYIHIINLKDRNKLIYTSYKHKFNKKRKKGKVVKQTEIKMYFSIYTPFSCLYNDQA